MHTVDAMTKAGCTSPRGLRLWEEKGLLGEVARSDGDQRRYSDDQLNRARVIAAAQFGGFDLETIKAMLAEYDAEVYAALMTRLTDQTRAAVRLGENLPVPAGTMEYDL